MFLIIILIILYVILSNTNKWNYNISKFSREFKDFNEKKREQEELKDRMRDLRKEIRKINEEIGKEELNTKSPYFQYLYKRFADLQIELDDYEFELK